MDIYISFHQRKGQAAPLLIMLIAAVLVCMMVVFNIGKVALNKVDTQNAADAGALAASSWMASGSNMVADIGEMMNYGSLGFVAMMMAVPPWPSFGHAWALIGTFCADQVLIRNQAGDIDALVRERAGESAIIYALINAGVDQQKREPELSDDYESWRKEDTPFGEFLQSGNYQSIDPETGESFIGYAWDRWTKYKRWDKNQEEFVTFKKERPSKVKVDVGDIPHINYSSGVMFGLTWYCTWTPTGQCIPTPLFYVVAPAYITVTSHQRVADVTVTREEAVADWGLWEMEIPAISSSATASTEGSSSPWSGGDYDSNLTSVR